MNISICKSPVMDNLGNRVDSVEVTVTSDIPGETAKDVLEDYHTIIKGLKEDKQ